MVIRTTENLACSSFVLCDEVGFPMPSGSESPRSDVPKLGPAIEKAGFRHNLRERAKEFVLDAVICATAAGVVLVPALIGKWISDSAASACPACGAWNSSVDMSHELVGEERVVVRSGVRRGEEERHFLLRVVKKCLACGGEHEVEEKRVLDARDLGFSARNPFEDEAAAFLRDIQAEKARKKEALDLGTQLRLQFLGRHGRAPERGNENPEHGNQSSESDRSIPAP